MQVDIMSEKGAQMEAPMLSNTAMMPALGSIGEHWGALRRIRGKFRQDRGAFRRPGVATSLTFRKELDRINKDLSMMSKTAGGS